MRSRSARRGSGRGRVSFVGPRISLCLAGAVIGVIAASSPASAAGGKKPQPAQTPAPSAPAKKTSPAEALLRRASAHEKDGKVATAWAEWKQVLEDATKSGDQKRLAIARTHLADTFKKLSYVKVDPGQSNATEVLIDGKLVDKSAWATPHPLDPGPHEVTVAAAAMKSQTLSITVPPGPVTQPLALPTLQANDDAPVTPATPVAAATETKDPTPAKPTPAKLSDEAELLRSGPLPSDGSAPPKKSANTGRTVGFVLGGVGIVGVGVGTYFGVVALGNKKDVDAHCGAAASEALTSTAIPCDAQGFKAQKDAHTNGTISTIGIGVGAAALVTGVVLIFVSKGPDKTDKTALRIAPAIPLTGSGGGVQLGGAF